MNNKKTLSEQERMVLIEKLKPGVDELSGEQLEVISGGLDEGVIAVGEILTCLFEGDNTPGGASGTW